MTQMTPAQPDATGPETQPPFLSLHTTVVLLTAFVLGLVVGGLTVLTGIHVAGAALAGLSTTGSAVPVLRPLIGRPHERSVR
ncbi:hypothetical protein [Streptomyces sp. NBC_01012]|uniref:hypothetical protein n=1 Tax=Streptomyces sp. NBC_01012 TaxID=2903717 RepID=UPI002F915E8B|nr:hypothetical protein OG623_35025 [Streptomyces sp. NBC_01012]